MKTLLNFLIAYFTSVEFLPAEDKLKHEIIGKRWEFWSFIFTALTVVIFNLPIWYLLAFIVPVIIGGVISEMRKNRKSELMDFWFTVRPAVTDFAFVLITILLIKL